eukprot:90506_1
MKILTALLVVVLAVTFGRGSQVFSLPTNYLDDTTYSNTGLFSKVGDISLSARAITNMLEALPGSASIILDAEAVSVMCTKLKATDYTDLIEQILLCFSALSKSPGSGARVLQDGGLQPVLWFMEWFPITVQRNCVE